MKSIDSINNKIGQNIFEIIKEEWTSSHLNIEVLEGYTSYKGFYIKKEDNSKVSLKVSKFPDDLNDDLLALHRITSEGENNRWNRALFIVTPDKKFSIEFIWDQDLQDEIDLFNKE
ncbi:MAG TPA: hypothetical protein VIK89_02500 [Cytophagaceae bacterium]